MPENNFHQQFEEATEYKEPGTGNEYVWNFDEEKKRETTTEPQTAPQPESKNEPESRPETTTPKKEPEAEPDKKIRLSTDETKQMSAETGAFLFGQMIELIGVPLVHFKFKKNFSDQEKNLIVEKNLEDADFQSLQPDEQIIKHKFDRYIRKRDEKLKNIPLSGEETKKVQMAFYNYMKQKNIDLPAEWILGFTLGTILIDRTIEVIVE